MMKDQKIVAIHINRSLNEEHLKEKMQKVASIFKSERREYLWAKVFEAGIDQMLLECSPLTDPKLIPPGKLLEIPPPIENNPPKEEKPKTKGKPCLTKKSKQAPKTLKSLK